MSKLYVGNVPEGAKEKDLRELFEAFGDVEEVAMLRGYGFVHFVKAEDASAALNALDDSEFLNSHIQVQFARTKGHGYGRGSGPPRPRFSGRGYDRDARGYRDSYRDGGGYRDSYRDSYRERDRGDRRYGSTYDDSRARDYRGGGGGRYEDYYDRYDYDRYRSGGYDHYADHYYDDRYRDYSKYADYREGYRRSRSPGGRGGDYYSSKDRSYYDRDTYAREDVRSRRW